MRSKNEFGAYVEARQSGRWTYVALHTSVTLVTTFHGVQAKELLNSLSGPALCVDGLLTFTGRRALHKKSNDEVREAVSEPEAVATG